MRDSRPLSQADLERTLKRIDGKGYKAFKDVVGRYAFDGFQLSIDHVQGDPFGSPSKLRVFVPADSAGFPDWTRCSRSRRVALCDVLTRAFAAGAAQRAKPRGSGSSGVLAMDRPGQSVLERSSVVLQDDGSIEARFVAGLPAKGRTVLGREAAAMLLQAVPELVAASLRFAAHDAGALERHLTTVEDADALRGQLRDRGLVAFVADGAILPRASGVDDRPMPKGAVPFEAPDSLRVTLDRPNAGPVSGLGVPQGITLIVGGGYHGKSTLLQAIERGVYNHLPGDGREAVVADPAAVKVRAEDGRAVTGVDISPFIQGLPGGADTRRFATPNASGSTSQAANIVEALEAGARVLMMDEDTSATNFMIRDRRMQALIAKRHEPITPYIDKVRQLYDEHGVSTTLVIGGSGDYLDVADTVIAMQEFRAYDVTGEARQVVADHATRRSAEGGQRFGDLGARPIAGTGITGKGDKPPKVKVPHSHAIAVGQDDIDLTAVEQLVDDSQTRAVAEALLRLSHERRLQGRPLPELLDALEAELDARGPDALTRMPRGDLARFRRYELASAVNRLRGLQVSG
jgi:predicted ABC-class ATPase